MRIGLYSPFFGSTIGGGEKYLGVTAEAIRDAFPDARVEIVSPVPADRDRYQRMLALDLEGIDLISTNRRVTALHRFLNGLPALRLYRDLFVTTQAVRFTRRYDLLLTMVYVLPTFSRARSTVILCQFPYRRGRGRWRRGRLRGWPYFVYSLPYRLLKPVLVGGEIEDSAHIICQSEYVRRWVGNFWHRPCEVVNPPIDIPQAEPDWGSKRNVILSVGRFFRLGHTKRHDLMVRAFKDLCDGGLEGWELHLAGSVHTEAGNEGYYEEIETLAMGYPIHLHPNASYDAVQGLYREASIYWHAAGYGIDEEEHPIALEHFGMTTAEAMGHGAVPLVIGRGGQPEVVRDGVDGFLWKEPAELRSRTLELASDLGLRARLGREAREGAKRFSREEFKRRMVELLAPIMAELAAPPAGSEDRPGV